MFFFRINKVRFRDNGTVKKVLGLFGHDWADVKFLSFVTTNNDALPNLDRFTRAKTDDARREILRQTVSNIVASREMTEVSQVGDNDNVTFGDTGYVLYQSDEIPDCFNWTFLAIASKRGVREAGATVDEIVSDRQFGDVTNSILKLAKGGASVANPAFGAAVQVAKFVAHVSSRRMMAAEDKQLGVVNMSLDRGQHYPFGERKSDDVMDNTGNMSFDYSIFAYKRALPV